MAIKLNVIKCPECGAKLEIEEGRKKLFCSYCGAQIAVTDENEYIYREIDEAKIKEAEVSKEIELKKLEIIEKNRAAVAKTKKKYFIIGAILAVIGGIIIYIGGSVRDDLVLFMLGYCAIFFGVLIIYEAKEINELDVDFGEMIKVPFAISSYQNMTYMEIEERLRDIGFNNIECIPLNDIRVGIFAKPNMVESISVNGKTMVYGVMKYSSNSEVIIKYHSKQDS